MSQPDDNSHGGDADVGTRSPVPDDLASPNPGAGSPTGGPTTTGNRGGEEGGGGGGGGGGAAATIMPKCVCSWRNCRVYQKFFRDDPVWDGVIQLKFRSTEPESMALKISIDRNLKVPEANAQDWKPAGSRNGVEEKIAKYNVACHHWTEQHIRKYRADPKHYSFFQLFSVHVAQKYLFRLDEKEIFKDPARRDDDDELLYLQSPLVPRDVVKALFHQIKKGAEEGAKRNDVRRTGSRTKLLKDDDLGNSSHHNNNINSNEDEGGSSTTNNWKPRRPEEKDRKDSLTVSTYRSSKTFQALLQEKEFENRRLKNQLEAMQSQLSFLNDMVSKLQLEHYDNHSAARQPPSPQARMAAGGTSSGHRTRRPTNGTQDGSSQRTRSRSSRSTVPNQIEIESEDDGNLIEPELNEEWLEDEEEEDVEDDDDDRSRGTFHVGYHPGGLKRGTSFSSRASRTSRATSIVSASKSVKSLPREVELAEDDDSHHQSLEEETDDNRFISSSSKKQHHRGGAGPKPRRDPKHAGQRSTRNTISPEKPKRRQSIGGNSSASHSRSGRVSKGDDSSLSGVYQVTALTLTNPCGEQGSYTGSISNSNGMPHGFGRLEYDKAGRWYEGDWRHGRWTGHGRLSNGDGDFYNGGWKNDHKHGRGVMKFADGRIFEGEYINGQMVQGKMTYQDGSTYTGSWVDGKRHGRGRCVFTDQSVYEGQFREGEFFGYGKMSWNDGGWYEGEWFKDEMQGFGKEIRPDGSLRHEGQWSKGQPIRGKIK
ncbi:hypothetical protein ACA910_013859 [Epithemia clementina (nom. ined.)]